MSTPMITVFRSRLDPHHADEYARMAQRMETLARAMPGFVDFKTFVAHDGERVSIVVFESEEAHAGWRDHPEHRKAQRRGRETFYEEFAIQVCELRGERRFTRR